MSCLSWLNIMSTLSTYLSAKNAMVQFLYGSLLKYSKVGITKSASLLLPKYDHGIPIKNYQGFSLNQFWLKIFLTLELKIFVTHIHTCEFTFIRSSGNVSTNAWDSLKIYFKLNKNRRIKAIRLFLTMRNQKCVGKRAGSVV